MSEQYERHWKDYYAILKLPKGCDDFDRIRSNYRMLMQVVHPDKNPELGDQETKDLNEAFEVLKDTARRAAYWRFYQTREEPPPERERQQQWQGTVDNDFARAVAEELFRKQKEEEVRQQQERQAAAARAAAEHLRQELERQAREAERQAKEEAERKERKKREAERLTKEEAERKVKEEEEERLAEERRIAEAKRREELVRLGKKAAKIGLPIAAVVVVVVIMVGLTIKGIARAHEKRQNEVKEQQYATAEQLLVEGKKDEALAVFNALGDYSDAEEQVYHLELQTALHEIKKRTREEILFGVDIWTVVSVKDDKALLITAATIGGGYSYGNSWAESGIREYLNGELYDAFRPSEKIYVLETPLKNIDGGGNTTDKLFCLTVEDANAYFFDDSIRKNGFAWYLRSPHGYSIVMPNGAVM